MTKPTSATNTGGPLTNQRKNRIMAIADLTAQHLRERLHYDPETGVFVWLKCHYKPQLIGKPAGVIGKNGYAVICIQGMHHYSHRLAWLYMTGQWPEALTDHMDCNRANNVFSNLRQATHTENVQKQIKPHPGNLSGFLGVVGHPCDVKGAPRWRARIQVDKKNKHLGVFYSPEKAHAAYVQAKRELHPSGTI